MPRHHWHGGDSHLVSTGDLLDRGPGSREVLDLLMRLEPEAQKAGEQCMSSSAITKS